MLRFFSVFVGIWCTFAVRAGTLDIQKLKLKGEHQVKELKYFQATGLIATRITQIEMRIEAYEKSLISWREAKPQDRNAYLKNVQAQYEKFSGEFKAIGDIYRDWVVKYQNTLNEKNNEPYKDTTTREKGLAAVEVGKQNEGRAEAAYNNRNYTYAAHLYLKSLRMYAKVFELKNIAQLAAISPEKSSKSRRAK